MYLRIYFAILFSTQQMILIKANLKKHRSSNGPHSMKSRPSIYSSQLRHGWLYLFLIQSWSLSPSKKVFIYVAIVASKRWVEYVIWMIKRVYQTHCFRPVSSNNNNKLQYKLHKHGKTITETKKDHEEKEPLVEGRVEPSNLIYRGQYIVISYDSST